MGDLHRAVADDHRKRRTGRREGTRSHLITVRFVADRGGWIPAGHPPPGGVIN
jgi:hypothetical protein